MNRHMDIYVEIIPFGLLCFSTSPLLRFSVPPLGLGSFPWDLASRAGGWSQGPGARAEA